MVKKIVGDILLEAMFIILWVSDITTGNSIK